MSSDIKAGDLVFLRDWPDESSGDWTISNHPPLLVIETIESKQLKMFGGHAHIESLKVMDGTGNIRVLPAGYFVSTETRDIMLQEIHRVQKR